MINEINFNIIIEIALIHAFELELLWLLST